MCKAIKSTSIFVTAYIICMIPTYILPYFGSNSAVINGVAAAHIINPWMIIHLAFLASLIAMTWSRGKALDKSWLVIFPILATAFDFVPF